jgi:hypothetical protein
MWLRGLLREVQPRRDSAEVQLVGDGQERLQVPKLHQVAAIAGTARQICRSTPRQAAARRAADPHTCPVVLHHGEEAVPRIDAWAVVVGWSPIEAMAGMSAPTRSTARGSRRGAGRTR